MECSKNVKPSCNFSLDCLIAKNIRHDIHNINSSIDPNQKIIMAQEVLGKNQFECLNIIDQENTIKSLKKKSKPTSWIPEETAFIDNQRFYRRRVDANGVELTDLVYFATDDSLEQLKNARTIFADATFKVCKKSKYKQCLILSARDELQPRHKQIVHPCVAILMKSKTMYEYR